jgi:hypothetical protein
MKIPVLCIRGAKAEVKLIPDFLKIPQGSLFTSEGILQLKKSFGIMDEQTTNTEPELKRKLGLMWATGKFTSKTELAKAAGLSDSYVCRILKHHS